MTLFISIAYLTLGIILMFVYGTNFKVYDNYPKSMVVFRIATAFIMCGAFNSAWFALVLILHISRNIADLITFTSVCAFGFFVLLEYNSSYRAYRDRIDELDSLLKGKDGEDK